MTKHMVEIRFDAGGPEIVCSPHRLVAKKGEAVEWRCAGNQPFTVDFGWDSPFPEVAFPVHGGKTKEAVIPGDAPEGQYEYFVAIYDANSGLVYTLDPEMIVRR